MQILLLGYKIKNAVQKSTPPEAKNFRDFHSQMQFSLNKLHFPDEKSASFSPAPSAPAKIFAPPPNQIELGGGGKILPGPKAPGKSWRFFYLGNEVYLVKIAFASKNLENFSPPAGYFLYSIFDFVPQKQYLHLLTRYDIEMAN